MQKKSSKKKPNRKKKQKKYLKKVLFCVMAAVMILPAFSSLLPQKQAPQIEPELEQAYMEAMEQMSADAGEPEISGTYEVIDVRSNTSLVVLQDGVERSVKLIGVDNVDEEDDGQLEMLLSDDYVNLEFDAQKEDENGNLLAYVYSENGQLLNEELLCYGFAKYKEEPENKKHEAVLKAAQELAKTNGIGIWADADER